MDLASLNIQRGRDHGITDYNEVRVMIGLPPVHNFSDISSNSTVIHRLASVYSSVDNVDLWVGGLAEDHYPGAIAGITVRTIITQQFLTLRASDRFWYQAYLPCAIVKLIEKRTLSDIIIDNPDVEYDKFPKNAFLVKPHDCVVSNRNKNKFGLGKESSDTFGGTISEVVTWYTSINNNNIAEGIQPIRNFAKLNIQKDKVLFSTPVQQVVTMQFFTVNGKKIATLIPKSTLTAGVYTINLPARAKGIYVIHAKGENFNFSRVVTDSF